MSNFTDFNNLEHQEDVHLFYTANPAEVEAADGGGGGHGHVVRQGAVDLVRAEQVEVQGLLAVVGAGGVAGGGADAADATGMGGDVA